MDTSARPITAHEPFKFHSLEELQEKVRALKLDIRFDSNLQVLEKSLNLGNLMIPNRLAIHPMEGCDGKSDGSPSDLTFRRYRRFGNSGAGVLWFEACSIAPNARANARQLMLTDENKGEFAKLLHQTIDEESKLEGKHPALGPSLKILQITHSGRYARPGIIHPLRMYHYLPLDLSYGQKKEEGEIITDDYLETLPALYEQSISLAKEIGFNGVDLKLCHRYLLSESLSAFTRSNSKYGGESYEQRTQFALRLFRYIFQKYASPTFIITARVNIYDGIPYPYGWGVKKIQFANVEQFSPQIPPPEPDLTEPIQLIQNLYDIGLRLINITIANPYFNPYISRPFDSPLPGAPTPIEHPLFGVYRYLSLTRQIRNALPNDMKMLGTGYSWLRQFAPYVAAAEIGRGQIDLVGFGRMAFAHPSFARQIFLEGRLNPKDVCITCSKCTELMRKKSVAGCVIRDSQIYLPYYKGVKTPDS